MATQKIVWKKGKSELGRQVRRLFQKYKGKEIKDFSKAVAEGTE